MDQWLQRRQPKMIKHYFTISLLCILTAPMAAAQKPITSAPARASVAATASAPIYELAISTAKGTYEAGELIPLIVKMTNRGDKEIQTNGSLPLLNFQISVTRPDGSSVPKTLYYRGLLKTIVEERRIFGVEPGQAMTEGINLGRDFDMSLQGTYSVSLSATCFRRGEYKVPIIITSNVLSIPIDGDSIDFDKGEVSK